MLNIDRLENIKNRNGKIIARCPACAENGNDTTGEHLIIYSNGSFGCCLFSGSEGREHRKRILELTGSIDVCSRGVSSHTHHHNVIDADKRRKILLRAKVQQKIKDVIRSYAWTDEEVNASSPVPLTDSNRHDPRLVIGLYPERSVIWTGETWQSGEMYGQGRFKFREEWIDNPDSIGPMISPATWRPDILSRSITNVDQSLFTVLDFDALPPFLSDSVTLHQLALSVAKWLSESLHWRLMAIIDTGNKSLHVWFDSSTCDIQGLRDITSELGLDHTLIGHPEHPCRLPNAVHQVTDRKASLLWLTD